MDDKYDLIEKIGEGSFGAAYKYHDRVAKKDVAIKGMRQYGDGASLVLREASLLKELQHENIIRLLDVINVRGVYLVYEYLPLNLKQFIERYPQMLKGPQIIKRFLHQILSGVAYLHAHDIVHKDLNPHNLLIDPRKNILKVADLGLPTKPGDYRDKATLPYMGPELLFGQKISAPYDMWAVGCIFAEMVTQKTLFHGDWDGEVTFNILRIFDVPNEDTWPGVSELGGCPPEMFRNDLKKKSLADVVTDLDPAGFQLLSEMLTMNPAARITADEALRHAFFKDL